MISIGSGQDGKPIGNSNEYLWTLAQWSLMSGPGLRNCLRPALYGRDASRTEPCRSYAVAPF